MTMPYYDLLARIHRDLMPRTYVEVGVRSGESLQLCLPATLKVGIDPAGDIRCPFEPETTAIFRTTSDAFFAAHDVRAILGGKPVELAFIDGMHLFEFALRDFVNLEPACKPDSVILIHDCLPIDAVTSARERTTTVWTGDVWKVVLVLKRFRPDLHVVTSDVGPSGLAMITNLDPVSQVLRGQLDAIVEEYVSLSYEAIAADKRSALNVATDAWDTVRRLVRPSLVPAPAGTTETGFVARSGAGPSDGEPPTPLKELPRFARQDVRSLFTHVAAPPRVVVGIRPESFEDAGLADPALPQFDVQVDVVEDLGPDTHVIFQIDAPPIDVTEVREAAGDEESLLQTDRVTFTARVDPQTAARPGRSLRVAVDPARFHFFDPGTGLRLDHAAAPALARA